MTRKSNTMLIALLGTILMGLATWVVITLVDKVIGRIYHHMDRLAK